MNFLIIKTEPYISSSSNREYLLIYYKLFYLFLYENEVITPSTSRDKNAIVFFVRKQVYLTLYDIPSKKTRFFHEIRE